MSSYKNLPLNRDQLHTIICDFQAQNSELLEIISDSINVNDSTDIRRVKLGKTGEKEATVDFYLNKDSSITAMYSVGKNHALGKMLADSVKSFSDTLGDSKANLVISDINQQSFDDFINFLEDEPLNLEINEKEAKGAVRRIFKVKSEYGDSITVIHHNSRTLQVQGDAKAAYDIFVYNLTEMVESLESLGKIIVKEYKNEADVINKDIVYGLIKLQMPNAFESLPNKFKVLISSGFSIRLSAPNLADYSITVYPDLRVLEGVLKNIHSLMGYPIPSGYGTKGFGEYYSSPNRNSPYSMKASYISHFGSDLADALSKGYTELSKHRNSLFHAGSETSPTEQTKLVASAEVANSLSQTFISCIEEIYRVKNE